jgi:hypothetical protein
MTAGAASQSARLRERELRSAKGNARGRTSNRSSARSRVLFAAGAVLGVVVIVLLVTSLGGGSSHSHANAGQTSATSVAQAAAKHKAHHQAAAKPSVPANAAEIPVAVLNGTETTGLAHRVASALQQVGYSQAAALGGRPAGIEQQTVVFYAAGHRADAEAVARSLGVTRVQPVEAAVSGLAPSASVDVAVGADKASP